MTTPKTDKPGMTPPAPRDPGLNDMAEDLFGLSLRGLATIRDSFLRPADLFTAARTPDWQGRYTPSVRLVISLIAFMLLLRIFWAGQSSGMYQAVVAQIDRISDMYPGIDDPAALADTYFNAWAVVFPFVYVPCHMLAALLLRVWGTATGQVVKIRLYFVAIVPGLVVSTATLTLMPLVTVEVLGVFTLASLFLSIVAYGVTVFRGMRPVRSSASARIWRAGIAALVIFLTDTLASVGANLAAGVLVGTTLDG